MPNIRKEALMAKAKAPVKGTPSHAEARDKVDDIWGEALAELFGIGIVATVPRAAPALRLRPLGSRRNRVAMDDLSSQHRTFVGSTATGATPEWNLDTGMLQTIQQVLG